MGIIEDYKMKLENAIQARNTIKQISSDLPDKIYILMNLDNQIRDYERKIQKLTTIGHSVQCDVCKQWVSQEKKENIREIEGMTVCESCRDIVSKVLMSHEAETKWNLPIGTIKQDCRRGVLDVFIENGLIRKAGKYWLIHELVGELYYLKKRKNHLKAKEQ